MSKAQMLECAEPKGRRHYGKSLFRVSVSAQKTGYEKAEKVQTIEVLFVLFCSLYL